MTLAEAECPKVQTYIVQWKELEGAWQRRQRRRLTSLFHQQANDNLNCPDILPPHLLAIHKSGDRLKRRQWRTRGGCCQHFRMSDAADENKFLAQPFNICVVKVENAGPMSKIISNQANIYKVRMGLMKI